MLSFQRFQMAIQIGLGNAFAAIQLRDSPLYLGGDPVTILLQPAILLLLRVEQAKQRSFGVFLTGCLHLSLQACLEFRIVNLNGHVGTQQGAELPVNP